MDISSLLNVRQRFASSEKQESKGFTLIELLVVIAIIAILVVIVIVMINPAKRLSDASDNAAAANVRQTGSLIAACITKQIQASNTTPTVLYSNSAWVPATGFGGCADLVTLSKYGTLPSTTGTNPVSLGSNSSNNVCAWAPGATSYYLYQYKVGSVAATGSISIIPSCT